MKQFRLILILWLCMAMNAKANETTANLLQQGDSCLSRYDVFHATQYYQKYLEANPSHLGARRKLASCYRKVGNYTACISCLDKIPSDSINHEDMRMSIMHISIRITMTRFLSGVNASHSYSHTTVKLSHRLQCITME